MITIKKLLSDKITTRFVAHFCVFHFHFGLSRQRKATNTKYRSQRNFQNKDKNCSFGYDPKIAKRRFLKHILSVESFGSTTKKDQLEMPLHTLCSVAAVDSKLFSMQRSNQTIKWWKINAQKFLMKKTEFGRVSVCAAFFWLIGKQQANRSHIKLVRTWFQRNVNSVNVLKRRLNFIAKRNSVCIQMNHVFFFGWNSYRYFRERDRHREMFFDTDGVSNLFIVNWILFFISQTIVSFSVFMVFCHQIINTIWLCD